MQKNTPAERLYNGIIGENPTFALMLGMCPTLAVTTSGINGIGMGLTTTVILTMSNMLISILRKAIPDKVRMPAFIVVVASFVTIVQFLLQGFLPSLNAALGIYIPLIGMGLGFTLSITLLGLLREFLGAGTLFNVDILGKVGYEPITIFILAPGAFLVLAFMAAFQNKFNLGAAKRGIDPSNSVSCGASCASCGNTMCKGRRS